MPAKSLVDKLVKALGRDRRVPLLVLAEKVCANAIAYASGTRFLAACDKVGARARCFGRPRVENEGEIVIGDDFALSCALGTMLLATGPRGVLEIGHGVTVNYGTAISATARVTIGDGVMIGPFCIVADTEMPGALARDDDSSEAIEIGERVWLAARVVVRPGARIGAGAVIAAGSVVEGEIPPNAVASGAPARVLRVRDGSSSAIEEPRAAVG